MHRFIKMTVLLSLMSMTIACQSGPQASAIRDSHSPDSSNPTPQFSDVMGRDWSLVELRLEKETITLDQSRYFTLRFETDRLGGTGAPNRFGGPYSLGDDQNITFGAMVSTMMAPLLEPEKLSEHEYLICLQNAWKWNLADGKLELYSKDANNAERILVFEQP